MHHHIIHHLFRSRPPAVDITFAVRLPVAPLAPSAPFIAPLMFSMAVISGVMLYHLFHRPSLALGHGIFSDHARITQYQDKELPVAVESGNYVWCSSLFNIHQRGKVHEPEVIEGD